VALGERLRKLEQVAEEEIITISQTAAQGRAST
jgi:hypothetical protein